MRRGHVRGALLEPLSRAAHEPDPAAPLAAAETLQRMCEVIAEHSRTVVPAGPKPVPELDYVELAVKHRGGKNRRKRR